MFSNVFRDAKFQATSQNVWSSASPLCQIMFWCTQYFSWNVYLNVGFWCEFGERRWFFLKVFFCFPPSETNVVFSLNLIFVRARLYFGIKKVEFIIFFVILHAVLTVRIETFLLMMVLLNSCIFVCYLNITLKKLAPWVVNGQPAIKFDSGLLPGIQLSLIVKQLFLCQYAAKLSSLSERCKGANIVEHLPYNATIVFVQCFWIFLLPTENGNFNWIVQRVLVSLSFPAGLNRKVF